MNRYSTLNASPEQQNHGRHLQEESVGAPQTLFTAKQATLIETQAFSNARHLGKKKVREP